ncbi:N-acetylmuramoyl-L-alanine amidase CwlD [Aneurinibacillus sp. Ricciae_BoGa-3]|uniref:N-acetylmuramoyl-L-alanine amidase CwlD n=1 Tax=Aneurinibacillus sp. Ricciae_BoGa-3 TaxID=3022697 RepID=UPI0023400E4A|nr:N-acetylmuramoyl-L-alanine amidase CwlD [Aneurinibacillus sp. Ricciae_BoGa-3]WCK54796.1 N-acetylmuramoyl-L-alanine amidase CwlD [Aneurinibacillus sp. Ricciae_BoGa-3]
MKRKAFAWIAALCALVALFTYKIPIDESWSVWSLPLSGKIIVLDAGHGGPDGGAVSKQGLVEKKVTLPIALYTRDFLQQAGALVIMTREEDNDLASPGTKGLSRRKTEDLLKRARLVKESHADLLVSVHLNAIPSPKWSGAQTFYNPAIEESGRCAQLIQNEIRRVMNNTDREAKKKNDIYILRTAQVPAVLVEVGFLSNETEAGLLADTKYQKQMANAIYQGILRFYSGERVQTAQ